MIAEQFQRRATSSPHSACATLLAGFKIEDLVFMELREVSTRGSPKITMSDSNRPISNRVLEAVDHQPSRLTLKALGRRLSDESAPMDELSIADFDGKKYLSWMRKNRQKLVWKCWKERSWLGTEHVVCDWVPEPATYSPSRSLPSDDVIEVRISPSAPGKISLVLAVDWGMSWWKALRVMPAFKDVIENGPDHPYVVDHEVYGYEGTPPLGTILPQSPPVVLVTSKITEMMELYPQVRGQLRLGKAKMFGAHTWVYVINFDQLLQFDGSRVELRWLIDG